MRLNYLFSIFFFVTYTLAAQQSIWLAKSASVNLSAIEEDYHPVLTTRQAPNPSGKSYRDYLEALKQELDHRYVRQENYNLNYRSQADAPLLLSGFEGNTFDGGVPLDNHLAVSNDGQIVSVVNNNVTVYDIEGRQLSRASLQAFTEVVGTKSNFKFDPRVIYDPDSDRFVLVMISGFECATSEVIMAFSATADATGSWHLYVMNGCPFDDGTFADYPMIALTKKEFFLTFNEVRENVSWQAGFVETLLVQINKSDGYAGNVLQMLLHQDLEFDGRKLRNLCPIKGGSGLKGDNCYFLSNRNFDIQNDTFFLVEITGPLNATDPAAITTRVLRSDIKYGVPPNAQQKLGTLATNDARVLDGFIENGQIQFVMNVIDTVLNMPAIYHGIIDDVAQAATIRGTILGNGKDAMSYPGIAYTGINETDRDAIIIMEHSSRIRNAGWSAIYYEGQSIYSEIVTVKEGRDFIQVIEENPERWGDYVGIQRRYNHPGLVWAVATVGERTRRYSTWIAQLARPDVITSNSEISIPSIKLSAYPNPANDRVWIDFELPAGQRFTITLLDLYGRQIHRFFQEKPRKAGPHQFSFSTAPLSGGIYFLQVSVDRKPVYSKKLIIGK